MQGYVVDLLLALRYLPKWLAGMKFKRDAAKWKHEINGLVDVIFESARENMLSDDPESRHSFMFKGLQEIHQNHEDEIDAQERTANEMALARSGLLFFLAGVETISIPGSEFTSRHCNQAFVLDTVHDGVVHLRDDSISIESKESPGRD